MRNPKNTTIMGSGFADMSTETLETLLQDDCSNQHDREPLTPEEILEILAILDSRTDSEVPAPRRTPKEALADAIAQAEGDNRTEPPISANTPSKSSNTLPHKLAWLVAVVALLATCTVAATAFQFDFFAKIASWTSETFQFVSEFIGIESDVVENDALAEFRTRVDASFETPLTPTWCPEGFDVTDITQTILVTKRISFATLSDGESEIIFTITHYNDGITDSNIIGEKLDGDVTEFTCGDVTHYLMDNNTNPAIIWQNGDFECLIHGDVSLDTLEQMIESIY